MKSIRWIILLSFLGFFGMTSCEKESKEWTELPPETQKGANTIGCLVNGELWATSKRQGSFKYPAMIATYVNHQSYVNLDFYAEGVNGTIGFTIKNPRLGSNNAEVFCRFNSTAGCTIMLENISELYITKMDIDKKILSGRFAFDVPCKEDTTKILHITEGRFDMYMRVSGE